MSATLESFFSTVEIESPIYTQTMEEKIRQRRHQMLIHSYLYYVLDESVIDDGKWQQWADELVELQKQKKDIGFYDDVFDDWDGSTGCHLPRDQWIVLRARWLLKQNIS